MKRRLLTLVLVSAMTICLLPATASAAGGNVTIKGASINSTTPYYDNKGNTYGTEPASWNAWLDVGNNTLHLKGLDVDSNRETPLLISGFSTLYIELDGGLANSITVSQVADIDTPTYAIDASDSTNLVINGSGSLSVEGASTPEGIDGVAIRAQSIKLQYPADLTVKGKNQATSTQIVTSVDAYGSPVNSSGIQIADYQSNIIRYESEPFVHFTPKAAAVFPVWVNSSRIDDSYLNGKSLGGGTVTYTPAVGNAAAILSLDGVRVEYSTFIASNYAGVLAEEEPLRIRLIGDNVVDVTERSGGTTSGIYSAKALAIEATPGAKLYSSATGSSGMVTTTYAIRSDKSLTLVDGCTILSPSNARISTDDKFISDSDGVTALNNATIGNVSVDSVTVSPATANIAKGASHTFTAAVSGKNNPMQTVTWGVEGESSASTTIDANGVLTVGGDEAAQALTVRATSTVDSTKNGTAVVTVVAPTPMVYQITKGANGTWAKGDSAGLDFTSNGDYGKFVGVFVDGSQIPNDRFTAARGSTVIALNAAYLETLSVGQHTLRIAFTDGNAETNFTVNAAVIRAETAKTADNVPVTACLCALLVATVGLAASSAIRHRRRGR